MKYALVALLALGSAAHAGQGSFRGGIAYDEQTPVLPKLVVINENGGEYAPGLYFVQVMNIKTQEKYIMILRPDQIITSNGQRIVDFGTRSQSI